MADSALSAGSKLGRFQLLATLGAGGMGRVWVAREENTRRLFAIKTTLGDEQAGGEFWNVLLDEARIVAQLQHPSICAIHAFEVDEQRGVPYLVMDFSDGGSLHELLTASANHRLDPVLAASIACAICSGLQIAHDLSDENGHPLGVVHRDVSPQNILISSTGHVQLTDFGVAKARGRVHAATVSGEIKGKLSYMAPEQVTTRDVDHRADVFALGCVLYEATVGERPFHGADAVATLYQLLEEPLVLPSTRLAGYPSTLEQIVVTALQRDPALRYQSAEEFGNALSAWIAAQGRFITELDIARVVQEALGASIAERIERIAAAQSTIDSPPVPTEHTLSGSAANAFSIDELSRARRSKAKWAAVTSACAVVLLAGLSLISRHHDPNSPHPSAELAKLHPALAPSAATPAPDGSITITLRAEPATAALFLDDGAALPNPYSLSVAPGPGSHRVRATATGFGEHVEEVRFDRGKEVVLSLAALPANARGAGTASGSVATPTKTPNGAKPPPHTETRSPELPPIRKKPPRALDSDNPFGSP